MPRPRPNAGWPFRLRAKTWWRYVLFMTIFIGIPTFVVTVLAFTGAVSHIWHNIMLGLAICLMGVPGGVLGLLMQFGVAEVVYTRQDLKYWHMRFMYGGFFDDPLKGSVLEEEED